MPRSLLAPVAVAFLALLVVFGCGGGSNGGGTSSSGGDTGGDSRAQAVLTLVAVPDSSATAASQALSNLVENQTVLVRALSVERTGVGSYVDVTNLEVTSPAGIAHVNEGFGTITTGNDSPNSYTVRATLNGQILSATLRVAASAGRVQVTGKARTPALAGISGAAVSFYTSTDTDPLATVNTGPAGTYVAYVPTNAARVSFDVSAVRALNGSYVYYNTYAFGSLYYDAALGCPAPIPTLGGPTTLNDAVFFTTNQSSGVPPPPTGCGG